MKFDEENWNVMEESLRRNVNLIGIPETETRENGDEKVWRAVPLEFFKPMRFNL